MDAVTNTSDVVICCEDLGHSYDGATYALENVNLAIHRREVVGVIGQNGSGKTTLVKHFNGLLKPSRGRVVVDGLNTLDKTIGELSRHTGYVFQNPNHQLFAKTVAEELAFGPTNLGLDAAEVQERVDQSSEFFRLGAYLDKHPYRLSFPLRKLVCMASLYAMRPAVMVLDEPTTGQDNRDTRVVYDLIDRLRQDGTTIIIVSHDMELIAECTNRVVVTWKGQVIADDTPQHVFTNDELMERTRLHPPQITELSRRLNGRLHCGVALNVQDLVDAVASALGGTCPSEGIAQDRNEEVR